MAEYKTDKHGMVTLVDPWGNDVEVAPEAVPTWLEKDYKLGDPKNKTAADKSAAVKSKTGE